MNRFCVLAALAVLLAVPSATAQLLPVPPADTAGMEPAVKEQLEADRKALAEAIARSPAGSRQLAEAYGRCGQLHTLYKLNDTARACLENAVRLAPGDVRWTYSLGALLQALGDFEGAEARLARAQELRPEDPALRIRLGEARLQLGRLDEAGKAFAAALGAPATAAAAHFGLGRVALAQGDARAAAEHFEAALKSQPGASEIRSPLALAYRKLGRLDDARAALAGYGDGRVTFPDPLLDEVAQRNAGSRQYALAGTAALRDKRFAEAAAAYRKALEADPRDAAIWADLGVALQGLQDLAGAEQSYRKAVELEPTLARAHYNLGTLLAARGSRKEGIEHLETAVRLDPESKGALFNLGQALAAAGEPARALDAWDRLLKLDPRDTVARFHRAQALSALGRPAEAAAELGEVVAADPGEVVPRLAQASALLSAGRDADARARLEEGVARLPGREPLAQLLVRVLASSGNPQVRDGRKALEIAQKLLAAGSTPDREEALALALGETGRFAEAADHQRRALSGTPAGPDRARRERCLALYERNEPCRAPGR
ncbi:MAG TPA: tetratricopeptide repeat protein [Thermoanaerobaculia bacterium]